MVFLLGPQTKWQPLEILHNNPHPQLRHVFEQNQLNEKMGGRQVCAFGSQTTPHQVPSQM